MIARAAGSALPPCSPAATPGSASTICATGSPHPMTPVEHGSTDSAPPGSSSAAAAAAHTASDAPTPSPAAHTLEILLLTTIACSAGDSASRFRPTVIGEPQSALLVKQAAKCSEGASSTIIVRFMVDGIGASSGTKLKPPVATRKPAGSADSETSHDSYSASELKASSARGAGPPRSERCGAPPVHGETWRPETSGSSIVWVCDEPRVLLHGGPKDEVGVFIL